MFWFYILDNCDHAGIFDADIESASFHIGINYTQEEILETFNRKIVPFKKDKWFIPKFVEYQYGELNENNRAHLSVINILKKYKLLGSNKALKRTLKGGKDKSKSKSKPLVKDKDKESPQDQQLTEVKNSLKDLQKNNPHKNALSEFEKFKDYLLSSGKTYKNYMAAFRNWLRNDFSTSTEKQFIKDPEYERKCPKCDFKRVISLKTSAVCPTHRDQLQ